MLHTLRAWLALTNFPRRLLTLTWLPHLWHGRVSGPLSSVLGQISTFRLRPRATALGLYWLHE